MKLDIVRELEAHAGYPAVSVLLETHRTSPDNRRDPIVLKNLIAEAEVRLNETMDKREASALVNQLRDLAEHVDHEHNTEGLGLFVSKGFDLSTRFPFAVPSRVQVDRTFAIRDLVRAQLQSPRYWVLVISEKPTRLFFAVRDELTEVLAHGFPFEHTGPGGEATLPGGIGVNPSAVRDAHRREFVRAVLKGFAEARIDENLPLLVTGTPEFLSDLEAVAPHVEDLLGMLGGSYDFMTAHDLGRVVWPVAETGFALRRTRFLNRLEAAVGGGNYASGLAQVWEAAKEGRVNLLLVEEDYHEAATFDPEAESLTPVLDATNPDAQDDAVDLAVQRVMAKGGRVVFIAPGQLAAHGRIASVLRY